MSLKDIKHKIARLTIGTIVLLTIKKHKINVVVIVSNKIPTLLRESLYNKLPPEVNPRRNIESMRNEFSVGLFILGEKYYPSDIISWIKFIIFSLFRLIYIKPYPHTLILDLNHESTKIFGYWMSIIKPFLSLVEESSEKIKISKEYSQNVEIINNQNLQEITNGNETKVGTIVKEYFSTNDEQKDSNANLPLPRIRFTNLPDGSMVVDACYFFHPIPLNSILEMFSDNTILVTNPTNIKSLENKPNTTYIFYGRKRDFDPEIKKFVENYLHTYA